VISTTELTEIRAVMTETRTDTAQLRRKVDGGTSDDAGGVSSDFTNVGSPFACRVAPAFVPPREQQQASRLTQIDQWLVYVAHTQDVTASDQLVVTSTTRGSFTLEVQGVLPPRSIDLEKVLYCQRIG
jgi:hypothetical protein